MGFERKSRLRTGLTAVTWTRVRNSGMSVVGFALLCARRRVRRRPNGHIVGGEQSAAEESPVSAALSGLLDFDGLFREGNHRAASVSDVSVMRHAKSVRALPG